MRPDPAHRAADAHQRPEPVRRVLPIEAARYLSKEVLVAVVNGGSGRRAALPNYQVVGKTGTAQVPYEDRRGYEPEAYLASFMGAAPADDPISTSSALFVAVVPPLIAMSAVPS